MSISSSSIFFRVSASVFLLLRHERYILLNAEECNMYRSCLMIKSIFSGCICCWDTGGTFYKMPKSAKCTTRVSRSNLWFLFAFTAESRAVRFAKCLRVQNVPLVSHDEIYYFCLHLLLRREWYILQHVEAWAYVLISRFRFRIGTFRSRYYMEWSVLIS